jgi:GH15 family glucan-1,4-alpha-glucosidase
MVASLSVPWGDRGEERGGYHLVWPRDLVECAGALLALGALEDARNVLRYLIATQLEDGHWYQNQWLGGRPYWGGIQLDEAAFPVLLAAVLAERDALDGINVRDMAGRALSFIMRHGPASDQDRWEEDAGVNTFTLAVCISALVGGAADNGSTRSDAGHIAARTHRRTCRYQRLAGGARSADHGRRRGCAPCGDRTRRSGRSAVRRIHVAKYRWRMART